MLNFEAIRHLVFELFVIFSYGILTIYIFEYSIDLLKSRKEIFKKYTINCLVGLIGLSLSIFMVYWFLDIMENQIKTTIEWYTNDDSEIFRNR